MEIYLHRRIVRAIIHIIIILLRNARRKRLIERRKRTSAWRTKSTTCNRSFLKILLSWCSPLVEILLLRCRPLVEILLSRSRPFEDIQLFWRCPLVWILLFMLRCPLEKILLFRSRLLAENLLLRRSSSFPRINQSLCFVFYWDSLGLWNILNCTWGSFCRIFRLTCFASTIMMKVFKLLRLL